MRFRRILSVFLCICTVLAVSAFSAVGDELPEGFSSWDEYYNYLIFGETAEEETPAVEEMREVCRNERFVMYYYENGADVYLKELATGKVWGSAVEDGYIDTSMMSAEAASNLLTVSLADASGTLLEKSLASASGGDFTVDTSFEENGVALAVSMPSYDVSFRVELSLLADGLSVCVPDASISEKGDYKLVSLRMLPLFGAARPGEDGYVFYPDGSGALMSIADYKAAEPAFYSYTVYCEDQADFDLFDSNELQDIKSLMLPVFGIKHTSGGVFAEIVSGAENARLHISVDNLYEACFELVYRTHGTVTYEFVSKASGEKNVVGEKRMAGDRVVNYHILAADQNTYSDMAVLYRGLLVDRGELVKGEQTGGLPLSVEFFMGISKSGIIGESIQKLTGFSDAERMITDLHKSGVDRADVLLKGWCSGGYDTLPTAAAAESKLGGRSGLESLTRTVTDAGGRLYLLADFINADSTTGKFNARDTALRDPLNAVITDSEDTRYWLNPVKYMQSAFSAFAEKQPAGSSVCLAGVGSWLLSDNGSADSSDRSEIIAAEQKTLKAALEADGSVAVTGGNSYVWRYADRLYDLPDNDSQYYQTDATVPFYQMLVHGYKDYSSLAANLSYDYNYQKLRFVETGSIPHFILTENSPNLLQGTDYDAIFSSEYSVWKDKAIGVWSEMKERLGDVWSLTMDAHDHLSDTLVRVTYSDGSRVYINYSGEQVVGDGVTVPAMDYVLVRGNQE